MFIEPKIILPIYDTLVESKKQDVITKTHSPSDLIGIYHPNQQLHIVAKMIDMDRLVATSCSGCKRLGKTPYTMTELNFFASKLGMKPIKPKASLVEAIRNKLYGMS